MDSFWIEFFKQADCCLNERLRYLYVEAYEKGFEVRPLPQDVMNVFSMNPSKVRAVVVGQDPYPGVDNSGEVIACGLSFATGSKHITSSLERLFSCIPGLEHEANDYSLKGWIRQGVFLLNNTPVVWVLPRGESMSPVVNALDKEVLAVPERKWAGVTKSICLFLIAFATSLQRKVHFILLDMKAADLSRSLSNCVIAPHPSGRNDEVEDKMVKITKAFAETPVVDWTRAS